MMTEQRETVGLARTDLGLRQTQVDKPTLIDAGIDQHLARASTRRYQKKRFEAILAERGDRLEQRTRASVAVELDPWVVMPISDRHLSGFLCNVRNRRVPLVGVRVTYQV